MADLPDIDTSTVGFLTYYNAIDQAGLTTVDPNETVSASAVNSYTAYDNGVEGEVDLPSPNSAATATFRVKTDGWFVVYMDFRSGDDNIVQSSQTATTGLWDLAYDWTDQNRAPTMQRNSLSNIIDDLYQELSNSGNGTFNIGDVGLTNYEWSDATTTTLLGGTVYNGDDAAYTRTVSYTSGTTLHYVVVTQAFDIISRDSFESPNSDFEGFDINNDDGNNQHWYGQRDLIARDAIPNANTNYTLDIAFGTGGGDIYSTEATLAVWS